MAEIQPPQVFPESRDSILVSLQKLLSALTRPSNAGSYRANVQSVLGESFTIPAGCLRWSVTAEAGGVTLGGETMVVGTTASGGSIGIRGLSEGIVVAAVSGQAFVVYDTLE